MSEEYRSLKAQAAHYFSRPHEGPATVAIQSPAAWVGKDLPALGELAYLFSDQEVLEIEQAMVVAKATGKETKNLTQTDFPLPKLAERFPVWHETLKNGLGFQVMRGLPVNRWSQADSEMFFWCFGLHLGIPGMQNPEGHLLGHVIDTGASEEGEIVRLYKTSANIEYHCDGADVVGLLCLNAAKSGGKSRIVSSVSVFNTLLSRRPELAARLFEPVMLDRRGESGRDKIEFVPITPCRYAGGKLMTFYHADYFRSVVRHPEAPIFTELEQAMFDCYEEIAADPDLYLDMDLQPGDIQLLSNHTNLHARTDYEDYDDPDKKRHLLRLWLSLE